MLILGLESTCDETACAVVKDGTTILSNIVASQVNLHQIFGGVVPELACRRHIETILPVISEALSTASVNLNEIDLFAVAKGPGLIGALLIGLNVAKGLSLATEKPFIGVNHIEAHLYAALMSQTTAIQFPCIGAVLSGGHTTLVKMENIGIYSLIGETVDDAIGEAFDKTAKLLGLPYPGGPYIEELASRGDPDRFSFKAGRVKGKPYHFSFSGLKTGVLYAIKGQDGRQEKLLDDQDKRDLAASFQETAFGDVTEKIIKAAKEYECRSIVLGGGVTANQKLRTLVTEAALGLTVHWPSFKLSMDNAAMIAGLGYHQFLLQGKGDPLDLEALSGLEMSYAR